MLAALLALAVVAGIGLGVLVAIVWAVSELRK